MVQVKCCAEPTLGGASGSQGLARMTPGTVVVEIWFLVSSFCGCYG